MKYYKKYNVYSASNVVFDCNTMQAYSYRWWRFVDVINGKVVFNAFHYSTSTCRHQHKVRRLLDQLNIKVDCVVETAKSLDDPAWREDAIERVRYKKFIIRSKLDNLKNKDGVRAKSYYDQLLTLDIKIFNLKAI